MSTIGKNWRYAQLQWASKQKAVDENAALPRSIWHRHPLMPMTHEAGM